MSNSKHERLSSTELVDVNQIPVQEVEASNGESSDAQRASELNKLDQIRDMLFGEHVAALQNDYQSLDKSLDKNISTLRKELNASILELRQEVDKKFEQLHNSLQVEESERLAVSEELSSSLTRINSDILTKIELETRRIDQALSDQQQEASQKLNDMVTSLQDKKVDRKSLATMFSQFAKELESL